MQTKARDYRDGTLRLSGLLVHDDSVSGVRPGIVLFPDARGIGDHAVERARRLAAWVLRPSSLTSTAMAHQHEI